MDVKEGFCWRCSKALRRSPVNCDSCGIAEYCTNQCRENDAVRHKSVECPNWSVKSCACCQKVGAKSECSGCYSVWYCNIECQRRDWTKHKPVCRKWQKIVKQVASRPITSMGDYPFYFSNSFPNDLLNLQSNEMKSGQSVLKNFSILLPACGDLRHVMKTVQSLPGEFNGSLRFVLNDLDPFPMARNVLLLFLISSCEAEEVSNVSTIWLSFQLPRKDYLLLQETLSKLIKMNSLHLKMESGGMIDVNEQSYKAMREVWDGWRRYSCQIGTESCANIFEERKAIFDSDPMVSVGIQSLLHDVPQQHSSSVKKWFDDGVILPEAHAENTVTHYNPTFTGRGRESLLTTAMRLPSSYDFTYCIRSDCIPFQMWDYLDMVQFKTYDSISAMCHVFNTHLVAKSRTMIRNQRLSFFISTTEYSLIGSVINRPEYEGGFDRIFASNLIDYVRVGNVLEALEPFLSMTNPHAALFTETFNWYVGIDDAVWPTDEMTVITVTLRGMIDCNVSISDLNSRNSSCFHEYYNNTAFFINYLRGDKYAEAEGKGKLPKISDVSNRRGLLMRDFRKGRNLVVPFNRRVAVRTVNMLKGDVRTLEWYRAVTE
ncbi:uncharacterized protein [Apostichopus japonicus]|uniref:uncharacterized protein n=1 Tax=Stichopus japonicus TaxID=307972 RepID=UPI003AB47D82